jgi:hypothetical protein
MLAVSIEPLTSSGAAPFASEKVRNWPTSGIGARRHSPAKSDKPQPVLNGPTRRLRDRPLGFLQQPLGSPLATTRSFIDERRATAIQE